VAALRAVRLPPPARTANAPAEELREIWREVGATLTLLAERPRRWGGTCAPAARRWSSATPTRT
jgi:hypothetical protein